MVVLVLIAAAFWWNNRTDVAPTFMAGDEGIVEITTDDNYFKFAQSEEFSQDVRLSGTNPQTSKIAPLGPFSLASHIFILQPLEANRANFEKYLCEVKFNHLSSAVKVIAEDELIVQDIASFDTKNGRVCARLTGRTLEALEHTHKGKDFPPDEWNERNSKFNVESKKMLLLTNFEKIDC